MKFVISSAGKDWRGTETMTWLLMDGLRARGHEVVVFCRPESELHRRLLLGGLPHRAVLSGQDANPLTLARCAAALRRDRPDVIITQKDKDLRLTGLMARLHGIPVIVRHVTDRPLKRKLRYRFFFGYVPSLHVANSGATRDTLLASAPWLDARQVEVIHNGIDIDAIRNAERADLGLPAGAVAVGYVGQFEQRKGIFDFAAAWQRIADQIPEAHAVIAGAGPREAEFHEAMADAPRMHWLGFRHDVINVIKSLDVFVLPSRFEGFGMSLAEAMAAEVACVAYQTSNIPELINAGREGVLVPLGDTTALADAVVRLCRDDEERKRLGNNAGQRIERDFSVERMLDRYEQAARSLVTANARA